ncbi:hypothetical protein GCM10022225_03300 [Plantactinospora mayteni]|uniref:Uncharacterized protein n=1 Tax=Plantactinospora mayteni TaxID=566021 RepID=A0ABQ4EQ81_9ACTN|nr:hypothetical protein Pma05_33910 [Plantactinospora mayteni]
MASRAISARRSGTAGPVGPHPGSDAGFSDNPAPAAARGAVTSLIGYDAGRANARPAPPHSHSHSHSHRQPMTILVRAADLR